jgi:hypothetical protein
MSPFYDADVDRDHGGFSSFVQKKDHITFAFLLLSSCKRLIRWTTVKIPVESEMNACVQAFGGELGENLRPTVNSPRNADYIFRNDDVVAELKCLENDLFTPAHAQKLGVLVQDWARRALIPRVYGTMQIGLRSVPEICRREWVGLMEKPVKRVLEGANQQVKATKQFLNLPTAKGVLLLANEGVSLPPSELMYLVHQVLKSRKEDSTPVFSSIDWIVLFSVNRPMRLAKEARDSHYWLPAYRELSDPEAESFLERLRECWIQHFGKLTGMPIETKRLGKYDLDAISL